MFRGSITIKKGDTYRRICLDPDLTSLLRALEKYKDIIDSFHSQSVVKNAY
jgi:hypothetical protein